VTTARFAADRASADRAAAADRAPRHRPAAGVSPPAPAKVRVHISSLVLDRGVAASPPAVARAIERELTRLLGERLPSRFTTPGDTPDLAATIRRGAASPASLASRVADALHAALCEEQR